MQNCSRTIHEIPESERPRERCLHQGSQSLSLREVLALILSSGPKGLGCMGLSLAILEKPGSRFSSQEQERAFFLAMETAARAHLAEVRGLGDSGQAKLMAAFELGRRYALFREKRLRQSGRIQRNLNDIHSKALAKIPPEEVASPKEWLGFVPAYQAGELGSLCIVEKGSRTHVNVDPAELFAQLLSLRPTGFFLFHNHPSGNTTPSPADIDLTRRVREISSRFMITLLGHGIVGATGESWILE